LFGTSGKNQKSGSRFADCRTHRCGGTVTAAITGCTAMKALSLLGMAQAAGKLVSGDNATYEALRQNKVKLLIIAADASSRTKRRFITAAQSAAAPYLELAGMTELGKAIGKPDRAVIGVVDAGFARSLIRSMPDSGNSV
jgi:ribosomal protein L7Ae-like RNA K-turn-binding protein